ncbi:XRE family transcriptional regulator [Leucobacter triazinivorans]|uniref:Helix-turn-helix domain-containing protein n=1 Tax=Leucobacter triazinivorans TaxID=1784719 RepID=A0A4P6KGF9_9MICO|nr:XRE family transcriptional regulator [Leucobacter triazinivorans]QBE49595.1 helix-turn-helix domain-containing protein [Leucobacter triazinivorans]
MSGSQPVGGAVRRLRAALGLSQSELADRAGIAAGTMSMIENDRISATAEAIEALSTVLDCSPDYLRRDNGDLLAGRPWLRAYADAPSRTVESVVADSSTAIDAAQRLDLRFVPDVLPIFSGDPNNDADIEEFTAQVRVAAGLGEDDVVKNMVRTAERLGCVVLPMESELGRHLGMSNRVDGTAVIRVARSNDGSTHYVPGDRQRFTVAHELGHLVMHFEQRPPDSAVEAARIEKQAHRFAAAFLAPADPLIDDLNRIGGRVTLSALAQLKEAWGVAIKALVVRFQHLGVIEQDHARSLYKQISARRWNKSEPVHVPNEESVWLAKALKKRFGSEGDPFAGASVALGLGRSYFERWAMWAVENQADAVAEVVQLGFGKRIDNQSLNEESRGQVLRMPVR